MMEDGDEEEDNDDQYRSMFSECDDTAMDDNEEEGGEEQASDDPVDDDLRRAISDARRDCGTDKERLQFDKMLEDHHKLLYPGCEDGHRKLGSILELLKWKAEVGVTDSGFEKLMIILKKLFPRNNELPVSTYEAKKLVCPLGLDVQKIHACINDCILYRGEKYENLNKCPICGALRYKIRKDDPGDVEGEPPRKRVPAKVMWYAPIIPRLKRLFRNKEHAQLLRWHMEERKKDAMLRHPADGRQWRNIGREFPDFAGFLGVYGKSKDTTEAREDQKHHKGRDGKHPGKFEGPASYALTKQEKEIFFEALFSIKGALPPALDLDSFPCVEEAIRVADEFCDQYRALKREVEILQEENQRLRRMLEYYSNPSTRPSPPHSGNNESLQVLMQNYKIEKLKLKEILMKRERNPSPSSPKE
ncbi:hypothetical protein QYE76_047320 [Lolium multiflorum]|uniref:Uncharacterized protein n=1 Tax=Lolium multiflorum TaxID=4521 RepID=A0AAD8TRI5_LOLMU|nr:hypothetical protein QYE76_047320 [Lolium multiflorum]